MEPGHPSGARSPKWSHVTQVEPGLEVDEHPEGARYDRAPAEEQGRWLLAALYPFTGGASFDAVARTLAPLGWRRVDLAQALASMAASSLVITQDVDGTARYEIPEAARASLGQERWLEGCLHEAARQHVAWCRDLVGGAEEALSCGPGQKRWLERLGLEQANLSAGLSFALRSGDIATAALLASELCAFWELRGPLQEARLLVSEVLSGGPLVVQARARLLDGLGRIALRQGDCGTACSALQQAITAANAGHSPLASARARSHLGLAELCSGRADLARRVVEQALAELDQLDSPADVARAWSTRALIALGQGRLGAGLADLERCTALQVATGDLAGWATSLLYRSLAHLRAKDADSVVKDAHQAAQVFSELGDQGGMAGCLLVAAIATSAGRPALSLQLAGLSQQLQRASGIVPVPALPQMAGTALHSAKRAVGSRAGQLLGRGATLSPLEVLARACQQGRLDDDEPLAVQALGAFQVLRSGKPVHLPPQVARLVKLVVVGGGQVHVEQAVESLWAEVAPKRGKRRLRNVLSKLSSAAGPLVLREGDALRLGPRVTVDAHRFECAARHALSALNGGGGADAIAEALAAHGLYAGELLPEDRYEDFAIVARERLSWLHLRLLDAAGAAAAEAEDGATVERCLRAALDIDPTDEGRYLALARYLISSGRLSAANQVLATARELLTRLELPVTPAVFRLEQELRAPAPSA